MAATAGLERVRAEPLTEAQKRLVEEHWRMPLTVAKVLVKKHRLPVRQFSVEDLAQEGVIGLISAARRYSPARGVNFKTYAIWLVRGHMIDAIRRECGRSGHKLGIHSPLSIDAPVRAAGGSQSGPDVRRPRYRDVLPDLAAGRPWDGLHDETLREVVRRHTGRYWPVARAILEGEPQKSATAELGVSESRVSHYAAMLVADLATSVVPAILRHER